MEIGIREEAEGSAVLQLDGRLDLVSASAVRRAVEAAVASGRPSLVVDLEDVSFVDSSGLGALIAGLKHARQAGGELRIAAAGEQVLTVLRLTRLDRVLRPYGSVAEARSGL
jgi:anti-sigma B factor antagonist